MAKRGRVQRVGPGEAFNLAHRLRLRERVAAHVVVEPAVHRHPPPDAPLVRERQVFALAADRRAQRGGCRRIGLQRTHVRPEPLVHVFVDAGQLLREVADLDGPLGEPQPLAQPGIGGLVHPGDHRSTQSNGIRSGSRCSNAAFSRSRELIILVSAGR